MKTRKNGVLGRIRSTLPPLLHPSITPLLLAAMLAFSLPALASNPAADNASDAAYSTSWASGQNGGYGFGSWTNIAETNSGYAGFFVANTNDHKALNRIWTGTGKAWGTFANGPGFNHAAAFRPFTDGGLAPGQTFTLYIENGFASNGGSCGFCLRTGFVARTADDYNTGRRFEWLFAGGSNNYSIVDGTSGGGQDSSGVGWTSNGLRIAFTLVTEDTYDLEVVRLQTLTTNKFPGRSLYGSGKLASVALFNRNVDWPGSDGDVYFNQLSVGTEPASPYALLPSTLDSGGRRITNTAFQVVDASVGGPFGLLTNTADQLARIGYPAQLYDLVGLSITAKPPTVDEEASRELEARYGYDDGTVSALPAGESPAWAIVSGPLKSVAPSGDHTATALASNVYQHTPASAQAVYQLLTGTVQVTVLNTNWDDYSAYAGDGIDDRWQVEHFGFDNPDAAPGEDPDKDRDSNCQEWMADTQPTNDKSFFHLGIRQAAAGVEVVFSPVYPDTRMYDVMGAANLVKDTLQAVSPAITTTVGEVRAILDPRLFTNQVYGVRIGYVPEL